MSIFDNITATQQIMMSRPVRSVQRMSRVQMSAAEYRDDSRDNTFSKDSTYNDTKYELRSTINSEKGYMMVSIYDEETKKYIENKTIRLDDLPEEFQPLIAKFNLINE